MNIRRVTEARALDEASRLEAEIWGASDPTPRALLVVFAHHGGVVLGAYDVDQLVGVTVGFPGLNDQNQPYLHSHLLGVLPRYRRQRIGEALKRAQWDFAQERGLPYIGWTYDPLMAPNAWFNLAVLGGRVTRIMENVYGPLEDAINGTLPTHRLWVEWNPQDNVRPAAAGSILRIPADVAALRREDWEAASQQAERFFADIQRRWNRGDRIVTAGRDEAGVYYLWTTGEDGAYEN